MRKCFSGWSGVARRSSIWLPLVAAIVTTGCAHRSLERLVQEREFIGLLPSIPGERTHFAYAELSEVDEERQLSVRLLAPDGSRQPVVYAHEEEAMATAQRVQEGIALGEVLPSYLSVGLPPPAPPSLPARLGPPLDGLELRLEPVGDRRYPDTWALRLYQEGNYVELRRIFAPRGTELRVVALTPDAAAISLRSESRAGRIADLQAVDLLAGGRALYVHLARRHIDAGNLARAAALLWKAELLDAPEEGELWFEKARLYALRGESGERVASALARAIPFEPALYRMRARTEPAFARLKEESSFVDFIAPRPLPGRDRAIQISTQP